MKSIKYFTKIIIKKKRKRNIYFFFFLFFYFLLVNFPRNLKKIIKSEVAKLGSWQVEENIGRIRFVKYEKWSKSFLYEVYELLVKILHFFL